MFRNDINPQNSMKQNNSNPYRRNQYNDDAYNKNTNSNPLKLSSSMLFQPNFKRERFQNENPTVYRVSPLHYQYSTFLYDEKGNPRKSLTRDDQGNNYNRYNKNQQYDEQCYNVEEERQYIKNNNYNNSDRNNYNNNFENNFNNDFDNNKYNNNNFNNNRYNNFRSNNYRNNNFRNNSYDNNYNNNNYNNNYNNFNDNDKIREDNMNQNMNINEYNRKIKYRTPDNYYKKQNFKNIDFNQISRSQNIDFNNLNNRRTINNDIDNIKEKDNDIGINPNNYYRNDLYDIGEDGHRHYSPDKNDYRGSRFGDYTYNYYLNAPMRGDKSEDWRFPPLYYYNPRYDPVKKVYTNM